MKTATKVLKEEREKAKLGGGKARLKKQHDKGKMTARERIEYLIDKGSSFFELLVFCK